MLAGEVRGQRVIVWQRVNDGQGAMVSNDIGRHRGGRVEVKGIQKGRDARVKQAPVSERSLGSRRFCGKGGSGGHKVHELLHCGRELVAVDALKGGREEHGEG